MAAILSSPVPHTLTLPSLMRGVCDEKGEVRKTSKLVRVERKGKKY